VATRKRTRASAKAAGARFERDVADHLAKHVDDRIDRRVKTGNKDRGDIGGVRALGGRVVLECKDTARPNLGVNHGEAEVERGNDDAIAALLVHKRHGVLDPGRQWVTCTVNDLIALLTGQRPEET
jgi:hypothetical protein